MSRPSPSVRTARSAAQGEARTRADERGRRRRLGVAAVLAALALAAGVGLALQDQAATVAVPGRGGALPAAGHPDPGVVHVHGLGIDPADGALYAATHSGLFRLPADGDAERIGNRYQDTMGFTVTGPRTFLASGHPDPREDDVRPPLLGLVESTDAGLTWDRLSLHGEADFHALQAAHGRVYGYDATSGTFMVSEDKRTWDRRAVLSLRDLAVSPSDPEEVLATTEQGVARSVDGGRTWAAVPGAPALAVLAWAGPGSLYGATADGTVLHSTDGGSTWTARGRAGGPPEAITVDTRDGQGAIYVAVADRGILVSADGGLTFSVRYAQA